MYSLFWFMAKRRLVMETLPHGRLMDLRFPVSRAGFKELAPKA